MYILVACFNFWIEIMINEVGWNWASMSYLDGGWKDNQAPLIKAMKSQTKLTGACGAKKTGATNLKS